jgi:hypothetical protein
MKIRRAKGMPVFIVMWDGDKKSIGFGFDTLAKRFVYCCARITFDVTYRLAEISK